MTSSSLLHQPATVAARRVALGHLDAAAAALARMEAREDGEALHDFRVALRRLRSSARSHAALLAPSFPSKLRRRLRELQQSTGAGRDAEVHLLWIEAHRQTLSRRDLVGLRWLAKQLAGERDKAYARAPRKLRSGFEVIEAQLRPRLLAAAAERSPAPARDAFAAAVAPILRAGVARLERRLGAVRTPKHESQAHRARIAAKHLRYLLEPVAAELAGAVHAVERLKSLQDLLGELHDLHTLAARVGRGIEEAAAERARTLQQLTREGQTDRLRAAARQDERHGLIALAGLAAVQIAASFTTLEQQWLGERARAFFVSLAELADRLAARARSDVEIERKYLLSSLPEAARGADSVLIEQGYIPGERLQERLRRSQSPSGERFLRTVKLGSGIERTEVEEETPPELFARLWPLTEGRRVRKRRYAVPHGELVWELDEFLDRQLFLAEVELPAADHPVQIPEWLAPHIDHEVTGDPAYLNVSLAR